MKKISRYIESGEQLAATLCDLYDRYTDVVIHSVPACGGVSGLFTFGVSVDGGERENAVYIGGHCYQLTEATERDRCKGCALRDKCPGEGSGSRCAVFADQFGGHIEFERYHFEKVKTY